MSSVLVCSNMSPTEISEDFVSLSKAGVAENLKSIEECVKSHLNSEVKLKGDFIWQVKDTADREILKDCEECYLPDHMKMQVLGDVRHISWNSSVLLMICEDGQVYAYNDQQLLLVAESLTHLFNEGITFPSKTAYHYGQAFEDMTEEELEEVRTSDEMAKAKERHRSKAEQWGGAIVKAFTEVEDLYVAHSHLPYKGGPGKTRGPTKQDGSTSNLDTLCQVTRTMTEQH